MKKIYSLVLFVFTFLSIRAQVAQPTDIPKVVPPSPNAASLGKYGDIPVGLYTGSPNINLPLFDIRCGSFSLPISLSYQSQGMKVEEKAGWVGLNWSLNAGGVITRSVRGGADENGYWTYASWTNDYIASDYNRTMSVCSGLFDTQPDIFYFNFAGYSGKFVLDATAQHVAHIIPYQNLKIIHGTTLGNFEIIDANGIRYVFNDIESTTDDNNPPVIRYYKSAWYLSKIITPAGEINFTYSNDKSYYVQFNETDHAVINQADESATWFRPTYQGKYDYMDIDSKVLSEINTPTEKIKFISAQDRADMPTANRLQSVVLQDNNAVPKKKFTFVQSYFGNANSNIPEDKRLKLDEIVESSLDDALSKRHILEYYTPSLVPSVKSLSQDYWGFYNGKSNNSMLTYLDPLIYGTYIANQASSFYGDRTPVFENSRVGTLKKITYPTGGTSELIYEANDYGYVSGLGPINEPEKAKQTVTAQAKISGTTNIPTNTRTFSIAENENISITFQGSYTNPPPVENGPTITINRIETNGSRTKIAQRFVINTTETIIQFVTAGNYEVIASVDGSNQIATATIGYMAPTGNVIINKITGGVRIKQIINVDPNTGMQLVKSYDYKLKDEPNRSSGVLTAEPIFVEDKVPYKVRTSSSTNYLGFTQGSHVGYAMVVERANGPIDVGRTEYYYTSAKNYENIYGSNYRVTDINSVPIQSVYSKKYVTDYDVCRGLLIKELFYNSQDQLIKEINTDYNLPDAINPDPLTANYYELKSKVGTYYRACVINCAQCYCASSSTNCTTCYAYALDKFYLTDTKIICPWIYKTHTTETIYDPYGLNLFTISTNYFYDNPSHAQITRTSISNSKGETIKIVNKYAPDKSQIGSLSATASAALDAMITANKIGPIIESEKYNGASLLSRVRTDYRIWDANNKIIEPEFVNVQNGTNPSENRSQFFNYDNKENILEQAKLNDVHEVYIWGYNKQYPVAKIIGTDYNTAIAFVDTTVLNNPASDQQLRDELNKIRTGLAANNAMIMTYTYSPLLGITSETDANNRTTYYEYDGLGRLKLVKDKDGKILKQYDYQYQKPVTQ